MVSKKTPAETRFGTALFLAGVFKALAVLTLVSPFFLILVGVGASFKDATDGVRAEKISFGPEEIVLIVSFVIGAALSAAVLAFLGYVLEILIDIWENTWLALADDGQEDG